MLTKDGKAKLIEARGALRLNGIWPTLYFGKVDAQVMLGVIDGVLDSEEEPESEEEETAEA